MPDWEEYFKKFYESKEAADVAAAQIKRINVLGERGALGFESLMNYIDENAYRIASQRSAGGRQESDITAPGGDYIGTTNIANIAEDLGYSTVGDYFPSTVDYWTGAGTAEYEGAAEPMEKAPNILKIFLGMEENVLPESEYRPTSWTKGDPEQGWRSIKDWSRFKTWSPIDSEKEIVHEAVVKRKINEMRKSVAAGEYTPDMAVKRGEYGFKGIEYETDVDLGHASTSIGYDKEKKQYYYSITDVWDFEPKLYSEIWGGADNDSALRRRVYTQASLMQASGKSIGLYDRYYLPEDYMKNWFGELEKPSIEKKLISKFNKEDSEIF